MQTKYDVGQYVYAVVGDINNEFIVEQGNILQLSVKLGMIPRYFIHYDLVGIDEDNVFLTKEEAEKKRELLQVKYDTEQEEELRKKEKWGNKCYEAFKEYATKTYTMNPDKPFEEHLEYILKSMFANEELYLSDVIRVSEEDD